MNCERIQEYLSHAADGRTADWEREAIDAHVPGCAECAAFRDALAPMGAALRAETRAAVNAADFSALWDAIAAGIDRANHAPAPARVRVRVRVTRTFWARFASAGAIAAILAFAMYAPAAPLTRGGVADNHVDVKSVEGGKDSTVTVDNDDDGVTVIWVDEDSGAKS